MNTRTLPARPAVRRSAVAARSFTTALALGMGLGLGLACPAALAQPRLLAQRSQSLCQLPRPVASQDAQTLLIDSAAAWQRHVVAKGEPPALGRQIRWPREQVLLHVLPEQPTLGIRVSAVRVQAGPLLVLRVTRPAPDQMAAMALSRPCVWVVVQRQPGRTWRVQVQDAADKPDGTAGGKGAAAAPGATGISATRVAQRLPP